LAEDACHRSDIFTVPLHKPLLFWCSREKLFLSFTPFVLCTLLFPLSKMDTRPDFLVHPSQPPFLPTHSNSSLSQMDKTDDRTRRRIVAHKHRITRTRFAMPLFKTRWEKHRSGRGTYLFQLRVYIGKEATAKTMTSTHGGIV